MNAPLASPLPHDWPVPGALAQASAGTRGTGTPIVGRTVPVVPTARAALVLALMAPLALVIGAAWPEAWVVAPLAGLVVLALVFIDAWQAGRLAGLELALPDDGEVGAPVELGARARLSGGRASGMRLAMACDGRLVPDGR
ncbi:hypothetical protein MTR62_21135, partial [Novosphingobium sp. 1949]|nr:hypothetical protein [Novosphingobium organovorum]